MMPSPTVMCFFVGTDGVTPNSRSLLVASPINGNVIVSIVVSLVLYLPVCFTSYLPASSNLPFLHHLICRFCIYLPFGLVFSFCCTRCIRRFGAAEGSPPLSYRAPRSSRNSWPRQRRGQRRPAVSSRSRCGSTTHCCSMFKSQGWDGIAGRKSRIIACLSYFRIFVVLFSTSSRFKTERSFFMV